MKTIALPRVDKQVAEIKRDPTAYALKVRRNRRAHGQPGAWFKLDTTTPRDGDGEQRPARDSA